jgi:hypothetical protein
MGIMRFEFEESSKVRDIVAKVKEEQNLADASKITIQDPAGTGLGPEQTLGALGFKHGAMFYADITATGQDSSLTRILAVLRAQIQALHDKNVSLVATLEAKLPNGFVLTATVVGYSVLGTQLVGRQMVQKADAGAENICFVDPAGLPYIRNGPQGASGAAGAIYSYLGLNRQRSFPAPVREAITKATDAHYHHYTNDGQARHCIHVVGPDLRRPGCTADQALDMLKTAYHNVLVQFASTALPTLRLLPISGGIFSGPFMGVLPRLTARALQGAFVELNPVLKKKISERKVLVCIFMGNELDGFKLAFQQ